MTSPVFRSFLIGVFLFLGAAPPVHAEWRGVGNVVADARQGNQIVFHNAQAKIVLTVLAADLVRVRMTRSGGPDYSWAVIKTDWPKVAAEFSGDKQTRLVRTSEIEVRVHLAPFSLAFYTAQGELISKDAREMAWEGNRVRCWKTMPPDEHYYGLGEKSGPLDKRGHSYVMWNTDPAGYDANTDPMYQTVPFFMALRQGKAYGIFFDNTYRSSFDFGAEAPDYYSFGADGGEMNYYFFYGPDPKKVLARYTELVGRAELPPLWSIGYIQGSARYYPESAFRFVAENFRHRHIPCDGIFFDTNHMDGNRIFTWEAKGFADPQRLISDLRRQGFRAIEIVDPAPKVDDNYWVYKEGAAGDHFLRKKDGTVYVGVIWPGESSFPDFTSEKVRAWWGEMMERDLKMGIAGVLTDMNEPTIDQVPLEKGWIPGPLDADIVFYDRGLKSPYAKNHNIYGMLMSAATRDGFLKFQPDERPFVITRATYAGGQRYAAQWTGDNMSTWEDLRTSLRVVMSMGVSGLPFSGSDVGGFVGYPTPELYTRWLQAGVFHPFFWTHTIDPVRPLDPWSFGVQYEDLNRRSIELRYRLLPYLCNAFYQETQTGLPIMRPLFLEFPEDLVAMDSTPAGQNNEFLFGEDLLVAPVVTEGETQRKVYFPKGAWIDFWTEKIYAGPKTITVDAPLDRIPMFARAGAIIPTRQVVEYVEQAPIDPLTFEIYPQDESSREYYEDDGISYAYRKGDYLRESLRVVDRKDGMTVKISSREGSYSPPPRSLIFKIHGQQSLPRDIKLGESGLPMVASPELLGKAQEGAAYDPEARIVWIKVRDQASPFAVTFER
ncbi:MAG: DUF4968 domain-containing protein [Acidobacteriia bacterium]|nr:DUF4968 domain-containing protein [Terriglobia bacterium]